MPNWENTIRLSLNQKGFEVSSNSLQCSNKKSVFNELLHNTIPDLQMYHDRIFIQPIQNLTFHFTYILKQD